MAVEVVTPSAAVFPAINKDGEVYRIAERYCAYHPDADAWAVQSAFLHAIFNWLNRAGKDAAAELARQAEVLRKAARIVSGDALMRGVPLNPQTVGVGDYLTHEAAHLEREAAELVPRDGSTSFNPNTGFPRALRHACRMAGIAPPEPSETRALIEVLRRHLPQADADNLPAYAAHDTDKLR